MKVKLQEDVYISTPTKYSTCVSCVFISDRGGLCNAPDSLYSSCVDCHQVFHDFQKLSKIFDL